MLFSDYAKKELLWFCKQIRIFKTHYCSSEGKRTHHEKVPTFKLYKLLPSNTRINHSEKCQTYTLKCIWKQYHLTPSTNGFPERPCMSQPRECSRPDGMGPWATWSNEWHPLPGRGTGAGWSLGCFPTQTILGYCNNQPVLQRLCASATKAQVTGAHHVDPRKASIRFSVGMRSNPGPIIKTIHYTI